MKRIGIALLTVTMMISQTFAQQFLDIPTLWKYGRLGDFMPSPDGKTVLYSVRNYDTRTNKGFNTVYAIPAAGGKASVILDAAVNANSARYTPDGSRISYLAIADGAMQLFEANTDGSNKKQITKVPGGINGYKYAPDMLHIAYLADVKLDQNVQDIYPDLNLSNARIIDNLFYRHWDAWHDYAYSHLFICSYDKQGKLGEATDLMKDERYDCPIPPHGDDDEYDWSPDGKRLAYSCKKLHGTADALSTNSDIYVYDLNTLVTKNVSEANQGYDRNPRFSPDGTKLAWLSMATPGYESDRNTLVMFNYNAPKAGQPANDGNRQVALYILPKIEPLTSQFDYYVENFVWADNARIYFTAIMEGTKQVCLFDPRLRSVSRVVPVTKGIHDYGNLALIPKAKKPTLVAAKMNMSNPQELFLVDVSSGKDNQLSAINTEIQQQLKLGKVEKRMVATSDGKQMLVWVIYPPDFNPEKKYPTLLYCQGGPQSAVSQFFSYRWNFQLMAANGYIVVAPNRRGLPGFGSEWNDAIANDYGGQCMRDYLSAIDDVSNEPYVDKARLGAVGASFGGYSVYWLAGNHNKRFKTFISHCGMFNMESWYGTTEEMFFANHDNKGPYWNQTGTPNNFDASPHKFVKNWDSPILVIHNEKDFRVPLGQGMEAFTAAQLQGLKSRFLYFPDENHWVTKPQNSILWQRVFFDWLKETL